MVNRRGNCRGNERPSLLIIRVDEKSPVVISQVEDVCISLGNVCIGTENTAGITWSAVSDDVEDFHK